MKTIAKTCLLSGALLMQGSLSADELRPMIDHTHDRVQTTLNPGLKRIGTVKPRTAREVGRSNIAIGCEMLPRDYGNFENFKAWLAPLGIVRIRIHAGWAKCETRPGTYDFAWLDRQVDYCCANGLEVLLETSYGNPIYPGGGGASLSDGLPTGDTALAAWDAWVNPQRAPARACVEARLAKAEWKVEIKISAVQIQP